MSKEIKTIDAWEIYSDPGYYDLFCLQQPKVSKSFSATLHFKTIEQAQRVQSLAVKHKLNIDDLQNLATALKGAR